MGDDEAAIETTVFPGGRARIVATDGDGHVVGRTEARTFPNGVSRSTTYDGEGRLRESGASINDGNKVMTIGIDVAGDSVTRTGRSVDGVLLYQQAIEVPAAAGAQQGVSP